MKTRIICAVLAAMLLVFTACGPNAQASVRAEAAVAPGGAEKAERLNEAVADEEEPTTTGEAGPETTDTAAAAAEINAPMGGGIAQIVEFYNRYANEVKAADTITIRRHDLREAAIELPALLKPFTTRGRSGSLNPCKDETLTEAFANGESTDGAGTLYDFLPVRGQPFVSELEASSVQSAGCVNQDDKWIITINLKDEPFDMSRARAAGADPVYEVIVSSGYGSCMDIEFVDALQYTDQSPLPNLPSGIGPGAVSTVSSAASNATSNISSIAAVGSIDGTFRDGVITAVFDRAGQLTSLTLSYNDDMNIGVRGMKIKVNSTSKQEYQFTW